MKRILILLLPALLCLNVNLLGQITGDVGFYDGSGLDYTPFINYDVTTTDNVAIGYASSPNFRETLDIGGTMVSTSNDYSVVNTVDLRPYVGISTMGTSAIPAAAHINHDGTDTYVSGVVDFSGISGGALPLTAILMHVGPNGSNHISAGEDVNTLFCDDGSGSTSLIAQTTTGLILKVDNSSPSQGRLDISATSGVVVNGTNTYVLTANGDALASGTWIDSDSRYKLDIKPIASPLDKVLALNGVNYLMNREAYPDKNFSNRLQIGFIAQELEKVVPEAVKVDDEGFYAVNYASLTAVLAEAIKEQHTLFEDALAERDAQIDDLQNQLDELKALVTKGSDVKQVEINGTGNASFIKQNSPNPFSNATTISYFVEPTATSARVIIADLSGRTIKAVDVEAGAGSLELNFSDYAEGVLIYSLFVNDQLIESKQMRRK